MKRFSESELNQIELAIGEVETKTSAELVVAVAPKSGSYEDIRVLIGAIAGALALAVGLYSPWAFNEYFLLPDAIAVGVLVGWLCRFAPGIYRLFAGRKRRQRQTRTAGLAAFMELQVSAAVERNGILFYVSVLEDAVLILPDLGIEGKVPDAEWNVLLKRLGGPRSNPDFVKCLLRELECSGDILAKPFPPGAENPNEIPDRPRMLP